jgi:hypothetical protein
VAAAATVGLPRAAGTPWSAPAARHQACGLVASPNALGARRGSLRAVLEGSR